MTTKQKILTAGSLTLIILFSNSIAMNWSMAERMYSHRKARQIGDLLTVRIAESANVGKDASRSTSKGFGMGGSGNFGRPTIDERPTAWTNFSIPQFGVQGNRNFSGQGSVSDSGSFESYITVRVLDVLPNGDLLIEGRRTLTLKEETVQMMLSGAVRVRDIDNENIVDSTKIANAVIKYESSGTIERSARPGIIPRMVDWINPF